MSSPRLTDQELVEQYGRRKIGQPLFEPQEYGYRCPDGHAGDCLTWSEFNDHIWCYKCQRDYHYAIDCKLMRVCWMSNKQWKDFVRSLPMKPTILEGIQHFPDCKIPHPAKRVIRRGG